MNRTAALVLAATCFGVSFVANAQNTAVPLPASAAKPKQPEKPAATPSSSTPTPTTSPTTTPSTTPAQPATTPGTTGITITTEFDPAPFVLEEMGVSMLLPKGSKAQTEHGIGNMDIQIAAADSLWIFRVYSRQFSDLSGTTGELMKQQIRLVEEASAADGVKASIREHQKTAFVASRPAERVYFNVPSKDGKTESVRGITVFKARPGMFVFVEVLCDQSNFATARTAYEDTQTTLSIVDPQAVAEQIAGLLKAGQSLLNSVSEAELKEIVTAIPERWERLYTPAKDGSEAGAFEVGYRRIRSGFGKRSQFAQFGAGTDDQPGFYLQMDSRVRVGGNYADTQGIFFMSTDRREELWTLTVARKDIDPATKKEVMVVVRETGARNGDSMTVTVSDGNGLTAGKAVQFTIPPEGYVSRVEHYLLPQIMAKKQVMSEFAFYSYQHDSQKVSLRRDAFAAADKTGKVFQVTSSLKSIAGESSLAQVTRLRATGELIETKLPDGSLWEPSTIARLIEIWRSKNLPLK